MFFITLMTIINTFKACLLIYIMITKNTNIGLNFLIVNKDKPSSAMGELGLSLIIESGLMILVSCGLINYQTKKLSVKDCYFWRAQIVSFTINLVKF